MSTSPRARFGAAWHYLPLSAGVLPLVLACGSDSLKPREVVDASQLYWALELNHRAAVLATTALYDTLTLVATPRNSRGEPIVGLPAVQYTSRNVQRIAVTPEGQVRALTANATPTWVVVTLTVNGLTHADSLQVLVTTTPRVLASLSVHPELPDSAKDAAQGQGGFLSLKLLPVRAIDMSGAAISGLPVSFRSSDPTIGAIDRTTGAIKGVRPGAVTFYASTTAFGVTRADTLPYQIGWPLTAGITMQHVVPANGGAPYTFFVPSEVRVGTGAAITWSAPGRSSSGDTSSVDVVFAEANVPSVASAFTSLLVSQVRDFRGTGCFDIPFLGPATIDCAVGGNMDGDKMIDARFGTTMRVLTAPGVYEYHSTRRGVSGRIIVVDD